MRNLLAIGDLHGRDVWKSIDPAQYDTVIFVGDYTDSYKLSDETILENLSAIITLKQTNPDKVVLLVGNHDIQYLHYPENRCSGFRPTMQAALTKLFREHKALFQVAWQQENFLVTHAGLTKRWWNWAQSQIPQLADWAHLPLAEQLNRLHQSPQRWIMFTVGPARGGFQIAGPLWADEQDTQYDPLPGYHQIVGHTPQRRIRTHQPTADTAVTYVDVTDTLGATFYEWAITESTT